MVRATLVKVVLGVVVAASAAAAAAVVVQGDIRAGTSQAKAEAMAPALLAPVGAGNLVAASGERSARAQAGPAGQSGTSGVSEDESAASPGLMVVSWILVALVALRRMFS